MEVCAEKWPLYLELLEHKISWDVRRHGDEKATVTCMLCQRVLETCSIHLATRPLLLFYIAASKSLPPYPEEPECSFWRAEPQSFIAIGNLLPGCQAAVVEMLETALPHVQRLIDESKLQLTADVLRDVEKASDCVAMAVRD